MPTICLHAPNRKVQSSKYNQPAPIAIALKSENLKRWIGFVCCFHTNMKVGNNVWGLKLKDNNMFYDCMIHITHILYFIIIKDIIMCGAYGVKHCCMDILNDNFHSQIVSEC